MCCRSSLLSKGSPAVSLQEADPIGLILCDTCLDALTEQTLDVEDLLPMQMPTPAFLDMHEIAQHGAEAGLDATTVQTLCEFARRISADPQLQLVANTVHHTVFSTNTDFAEAMEAVATTFGTQAGMLQ